LLTKQKLSWLRISCETSSFGLPVFFFFVLVPVFLRKIWRQDRLRATISDSVDPQHPWFCPFSVAFPFPTWIAAGLGAKSFPGLYQQP